MNSFSNPEHTNTTSTNPLTNTTTELEALHTQAATTTTALAETLATLAETQASLAAAKTELRTLHAALLTVVGHLADAKVKWKKMRRERNEAGRRVKRGRAEQLECRGNTGRMGRARPKGVVRSTAAPADPWTA